MSARIIWKRRPEPTSTNNRSCSSQRTNPAVTLFEPYATYSPGIMPTPTANKRHNKHHRKASDRSNTEHKHNVVNGEEEGQPITCELEHAHSNDNSQSKNTTAAGVDATDITHNQSNTNKSFYDDHYDNNIENVHKTEITVNNNTKVSNSNNIVVVESSSEEDKEFTRIEREARIALECIAARDVDVEVQMPFYVEVLRQYRTMCENRSLYKEAHILQQVLRHLRLEEETRHVRGMTAQQMAERNSLDEMHREAFRQFHKEWNEKIDAFEEAQLEQETALLERQNEELEAFYNEMNGFHPHILRYSKRLIELRCKQHHLARQRDYLSAHEFKQKGDEVEIRDGNEFNSVRSAMYGRRERALQRRHEQELKALRMKVNERRCALERQRKQQLDELLQRYINVRREMEMQHRVVRSKTGNVLLKHACNLKSDWSGSAALVESVESGAFGSIIQRRLISETRITPPPPSSETAPEANNKDHLDHQDNKNDDVRHAQESINTNISTDTIERQTGNDVHESKDKSPTSSKEEIHHCPQKEELELESESEYEYVYEEEEENEDDDQSSKHSPSIMPQNSNEQQTEQVNNTNDDKVQINVIDKGKTEEDDKNKTTREELEKVKEQVQSTLTTEDKVEGENDKHQLSSADVHKTEHHDQNKLQKKQYDQEEEETQEEHHKQSKIVEHGAEEGEEDTEYEEYEESVEYEEELEKLNSKYAVSSEPPSSNDNNKRTSAVQCEEVKSVEEEQREEQPPWLEEYPTENVIVADAQKEQQKMYITDEKDKNTSYQINEHDDIRATEANVTQEVATQQNQETNVLTKLIGNPEMVSNCRNDHTETTENQTEEEKNTKQRLDEINEPEWLELEPSTDKRKSVHDYANEDYNGDNTIEKVNHNNNNNNNENNNEDSTVQNKEAHALSYLEETDSESSSTSQKILNIDDEDGLHELPLTTEHEKGLTQEQVKELANPQWLEIEEIHHADDNLQEMKENEEEEQLLPTENERHKCEDNEEQEQEWQEYEYEYEEEEEEQQEEEEMDKVTCNAFPVEEDNNVNNAEELEPEFLRNDDNLERVKEQRNVNIIESENKNANVDLNNSASNNTDKLIFDENEHSVVSDNITAETRVETTILHELEKTVQ